MMGLALLCGFSLLRSGIALAPNSIFKNRSELHPAEMILPFPYEVQGPYQKGYFQFESEKAAERFLLEAYGMDAGNTIFLPIGHDFYLTPWPLPAQEYMRIFKDSPADTASTWVLSHERWPVALVSMVRGHELLIVSIQDWSLVDVDPFGFSPRTAQSVSKRRNPIWDFLKPLKPWQYRMAATRGVVYHEAPFGITTDFMPLFPNIYPPDSVYAMSLLEEVLNDISPRERILVLGCGSGIDAVKIAMTHPGILVDAVDIQPLAVANTKALVAQLGLQDRVRVWLSDGLKHVPAMRAYERIVANLPVPTAATLASNAAFEVNREDVGGALLSSVLNDAPERLKQQGKLSLMTLRQPWIIHEIKRSGFDSQPIQKTANILIWHIGMIPEARREANITAYRQYLVDCLAEGFEEAAQREMALRHSPDLVSKIDLGRSSQIVDFSYRSGEFSIPLAVLTGAHVRAKDTKSGEESARFARPFVDAGLLMQDQISIFARAEYVPYSDADLLRLSQPSFSSFDIDSVLPWRAKMKEGSSIAVTFADAQSDWRWEQIVPRIWVLCPPMSGISVWPQGRSPCEHFVLAPRSQAEDGALVRAMLLKANEGRNEEDSLARHAETAPPNTGEQTASDPIMVKLIEQVRLKTPDGKSPLLSDEEIAKDLEILGGKNFKDDNQTQEMVEAVGQRYGFSVLRIPNAPAYKRVLRQLQVRAKTWGMIRRHKKISPLTIFRRIKAYRDNEQPLDPRIMFEVYLDCLGPISGKKELTRHLNKLEGAIDDNPRISDDEMNFIAALALYLHPENISNHVSLQEVKSRFVQWWKQPKPKVAGDFRQGDVITKLRGLVKEMEDMNDTMELNTHSDFPMMQLLLTLEEAEQWPAAELPDHLKPLLASVKPLLPALSGMLDTLRGPEGLRRLYSKTGVEWVDEMARRHGFSKRLFSMQEEIKTFAKGAEAKQRVDELFTLFPEDEHLDVWNHAVRVNKLGHLIGEELGMPQEEMEMLDNSLLTHDWGKRDPDISWLLDIERKLSKEEHRAMAAHGMRSTEIAGVRLNHVERLAVAYHNYVDGATSSEDYAKLSRKEKRQLQRILYVLYTADFLDALFDYARSYQRERPPLNMRQMPQMMSWMEHVLKTHKEKFGKDAINPKIVKEVRDAFLRIAARCAGDAPSTPAERKRDLLFQNTIEESIPFWAMYRLIKLEKENGRVWNADNYPLQVLDKARAQFLQRLSRSDDVSLEFKESLFLEIFDRYANVAEIDPAFPLDFYLATMLRFNDANYKEFQGPLDAIKQRLREKLAPLGLQRLEDLRANVEDALRDEAYAEQKPDTEQKPDRHVAAFMLGHLGHVLAMHPLVALAQSDAKHVDWKLRRAAVDTLGELAVRLEMRVRREGDSMSMLNAASVADHMKEIMKVMQAIILPDYYDDERNSRTIRGRAMYLLRDIQDPAVLPIALKAMRDPSWRLHHLALKVLGRFVEESDDALAAVIGALADSEGEVRQRAHDILTEHPSRRVIDALLKALKDAHFDGRHMAVNALSKTTHDYVTVLEQHPVIKELKKETRSPHTVFGPKDEPILFEYFQAQGMEAAAKINLPTEYEAYKKTVKGMSMEARRLVWLLVHPHQAKIAQGKGVFQLSGKKRMQMVGEEFFRAPMSDWEKHFKDKRFGSEEAWDEVRQLREDLLRRRAQDTLAMMKPQDAMRVSLSFFEQLEPWQKAWLTAYVSELGVVPGIFENTVMKNFYIATLANQGMLHLLAYLEGVPVGALLRRAILHERYHQAVSALMDHGILDASFERVALPDPHAQKEVLRAFAGEYGISSMQELIFQYFPAKAAETENYPSGIDMGLALGRLGQLYDSEELDGLCERFPLQIKDRGRMLDHFEGLASAEHPDWAALDVEAEGKRRLAKLEGLIAECPTLKDLLRVHSSEELSPAEAIVQSIGKIRKLTQIVELLRADKPRLVFEDKGAFRSTHMKFKELMRKAQGLKRATDFAKAAYFLEELEKPGNRDVLRYRLDRKRFVAEAMKFWGSKATVDEDTWSVVGPAITEPIAEAMWEVLSRSGNARGLAPLAMNMAWEQIAAVENDPALFALLATQFLSFREALPYAAKWQAQMLLSQSA